MWHPITIKQKLIILFTVTSLNASETQITKYYDSVELQKCDWKSLYRMQHTNLFFNLRRKLDTNLILHNKCEKLMHNDLKFNQLYDPVTIMVIVSKLCQFDKKQLEDLHFIIPDHFSLAKHSRYIIYSSYLQRFVDSIDKKYALLNSEFSCLLTDSNLSDKLDETNLVAFKDLIAVHISLLVGASVPELKKEDPKREWCHLL